MLSGYRSIRLRIPIYWLLTDANRFIKPIILFEIQILLVEHTILISKPTSKEEIDVFHATTLWLYITMRTLLTSERQRKETTVLLVWEDTSGLFFKRYIEVLIKFSASLENAPHWQRLLARVYIQSWHLPFVVLMTFFFEAINKMSSVRGNGKNLTAAAVSYT